MSAFSRPVVLSALISVITAFFILSFPSHFAVIFTAALIISFIPACILFIKKKRAAALFLLITISFTAFSCVQRYTCDEIYAKDFIESTLDEKEAEFTAVVTRAKHFGSYSTIYADIFRFGQKELDAPVPSRLGCYSAGEILEGDIIVFKGSPRNIGDIPKDGFNTKAYLKSNYIFCDFENASVLSSESSQNKSFISSFRKYIKDIFYTYIAKDYNYEESSLCYAMFTGDKDYLSDGTKNSFTRSGLTHLLCVSGLHLTILSGFLFSALSFLTVHRKAKCVLIILFCIFYTAVTGFSMSTVRACIICILTFCALALGRKTDAYTSLFFAMTIICALSPYSVFDISAQLSFLSSLGIICFSDVFPCRFRSKPLRLISEGIRTNLGAVIFSLPASCYYFGAFSTVSAVSTLFISFICEALLISLIIIVSFSFISVFGFGDIILTFLGSVCRFFCIIISKAALLFSSFRFSHISAVYSKTYIFLFIIVLISISLCICFSLKKMKFLSVFSAIVLCLVFSFSSFFTAIADEREYKISYFRQNENDRQLSIKLCSEGYLTVNADNKLCTDSNKVMFDEYGKRNYLLIIPDKSISPKILSDSILEFDKNYGLKGIYTTADTEGMALSESLLSFGIECRPLPPEIDFGSFVLNFKNEDFFRLTADDGKTKTCVVFADSYNKDYFEEDSDICAFFTRHTSNQFSQQTDKAPECKVFYTRLSKGETAKGITNTFGQKYFYIKE